MVAGFPWPFFNAECRVQNAELWSRIFRGLSFFALFRRRLRGCDGEIRRLYFVGTRRAVSVCIKDISVLIIKVRFSDVSGRLLLSF